MKELGHHQSQQGEARNHRHHDRGADVGKLVS
jgi:hypothetical protein